MVLATDKPGWRSSSFFSINIFIELCFQEKKMYFVVYASIIQAVINLGI